MRLKRDKPAQPALFAEALREWLDRSGLKRADVAKQSHVERSTFSHWLRGDRPPDPVNGVQLLITLYHQFQALSLDWTVAEALDGIAPLGWAWEDVWQTLNERIQKSSGEGRFRDWWQRGKPQPLPEFTPPLPVPFVPRTEQNLLQGLLTDWASWRQARWKAVLLSGVAGSGKTTLLTALARDSALRHHSATASSGWTAPGTRWNRPSSGSASRAHRPPGGRNGPAGQEIPIAASWSS